MANRCFRATSILVVLSASTISISNASTQTERHPEVALARGDYRRAEDIYREELKRSPRSASLLTNLGIAVQMQGRSSEAISLFQRSLEILPTDNTYALLAEERCKTRDLEEAKPILASILKKRPLDPKILALVAPCYLEADQPLDSVTVYQTLSVEPDFPKDLAYVQLAKSFVAAAQFFVEKLKEAPDGGDYLAVLNRAREGKGEDARSAYGEAANRSDHFNPDNDFSHALIVWHQHPKDASLLYQMSVLSGEGVIKSFEICQRDYPQSTRVEQFHAEILASQGRQQLAVAILQKLIAAHPDQTEIIFDLGMVYRQLRDWEHMADTYRELLTLTPGSERASSRLSEALLNLNRYDEIRALLNPIVEKQPAPLWAVLDLATAEQRLGNPPSSIRILQIGETQNPHNSEIHYRLSRLYRLTGDSAAAQRELTSFRNTTRK